MRKKVFIGIAVLLVILAVIIFTVKKDDNGEDPSSSAATSEQTTTEDKTPDIINGTKNPNKLVKVTLPLSYYDAAAKADTNGFINKGNYQKLEINEKDKTFTATMKSLTYDLMLSNVGLQVIRNIAEILDDNKKYPYVKDLGDYNSDFSQIELIVDKELYAEADNTDDLAPFVAGCGIFYQMYSTENNYSCTVTIVSEEDNEVLDRYSAQADNSSAS